MLLAAPMLQKSPLEVNRGCPHITSESNPFRKSYDRPESIDGSASTFVVLVCIEVDLSHATAMSFFTRLRD